MKRLLSTRSKKKNDRRDSRRSLRGRNLSNTAIRGADGIETTLAIIATWTTKQSNERQVSALAEQNQCLPLQNRNKMLLLSRLRKKLLIQVSIGKSHTRSINLTSNSHIDRFLTSIDSHRRLLQLKSLLNRRLWSWELLLPISNRLLRPCKAKASSNTAIEAIKGTITIIIITTTIVDEVEIEVAATTTIEGTIITTTKRMLNTSNDLSKNKLSMGRSMTNNSLKNIKTTKEIIEEGNVVEEEVKINNEMEVKTHS